MPVPRSILDKGPLVDLDLQLVAGQWPEGLQGELLLSTSELVTAPGHAFFGDGAMIRLSLEAGTHGAAAGTFAWRARVLDTASRRLRELRPDVFGAMAFGTQSPFGYVNAANTAPLPWGDRLFATWDAGRPVEVDPLTLRTLGEVGHRDDWGPDAFDAPVLPFYSSTAHPVIDPDRRCLWTVKTNPLTQELHVIRWDGQGRHVQRWPVAGASLPQAIHTVGQTRDWLVLIDTAFRIDPGELFGAERSVTTFQDEPVYLLRKDAVEATPNGSPVTPSVFRVGPEVNHYYGVWDDSDGIRVLFEHTVDTDLAMFLRPGDTDAFGRPVDPALHGMYNHAMGAGSIAEMVFDPETGRVTERCVARDPERHWATQLSALDWSTEGMSAPTVHHQMFTGFRPEVVTERALALYDGRVDRARLPQEELPAVLATFERDGLKPLREHTFALDDYATSPAFVPRGLGTVPGSSRYAGSEPGGHDGWIVVPVLNDDGFRVEVFDAADVAAGPLATLADPGGRTVPFLIHSAWMPRAVAHDPGIERLAFADELDEARLSTLPTDLAAAARLVAASF